MTEPGVARQRHAGPTGHAPGGGVITVGGRVIRLTNVSKVLFDNGITKGELVEYYLAAAEVMVPLIRDRPVVMMRYPDGIDGPRIVQKNVPPNSYTPHMRLLLAARLSRKQADGQDGLGIETQDKRAREWALRQGHEVIGIAPDTRKGTVAPWDRPKLKP